MGAAETRVPSWRRRLAWLLAVVLPAVLLRCCVLSTFEIRSGSMEPLLHEGDQLLVLRSVVDPLPLARWDVVLLDPAVLDGSLPEVYEALVKRVVGLPGERLLLRDGDVWLTPPEGEPTLARKPDALIRGLLIPVHRAAGLPAPWRWDGTDAPRILPGGGVALAAGGSLALARFDAAITEGGVADEGELVSDTALRLELGACAGVLLLGLREGADVFRARLAGPADGGASLYHNMAGGAVAQAPGFSGLHPGQTVLFWNVDNGLRLWVDGDLLLAYDYAANTRQPPGTTLVNTPELGLERGTLEIRSVELLRDVHYGRLGTYGTRPGEALTPYSIPPGDIFLLGDASLASRDSRHFGSVSSSGILGHPLATYWPWSRAHWLTRSGRGR